VTSSEPLRPPRVTAPEPRLAAVPAEGGQPLGTVELPRLADFYRRLLSATSATAVAQASVDMARHALEADLAWCGLVNEGVLRMAGHAGLRDPALSEIWSLPLGQGIGGRVAQEGRTIIIKDYLRDPRRVPVLKQLIDDEGLRGCICAPILHHDHVAGVLYVAHRTPQTFTDEQVEFVNGIAKDAGTALANISALLTSHVRQTDAGRRAEILQRALASAVDVASAFVNTEDLRVGLNTVAERLSARVRLLEPGGAVVREAGPDFGDATERFPVTAGTQDLGTLEIATRTPLEDEERPGIELITHLLSLQFLRERAAIEAELGLHSQLLDDLLQGKVDDRDALLGRAALLGVDLLARRSVVCIGLLPRGASGTDPTSDVPVTRRLLREVEKAARMRLPGTLVTPGARAVVLLVETSTDPSQLRDAVLDIVGQLELAGYKASAGIGRACSSLTDYVDSYQDAHTGLDLALRRPEPGHVLTSADLGIYGLLGRGEQGRRNLETIVAQSLGPLVHADATGGSDYVRTLDAYLGNDRHLERSARALHVHPNTLRYRITRIQEVLGVDLRDVDTRFLLELALRVRGVLEES
jgi:sugar diacid utilization regulator/putative methionine-R-sulfoxide reductase with GAF domain